MNRKELGPLVALALLTLVPALLVVYPPQAQGAYVFFDYQFTRPLVLQVFFLLPVVAFVLYSGWRTWRAVSAIEETAPLDVESRD